AIRILPGYIFAVAVPLFAFCIPSGEFTSVRDVLSEVIPYLTFTQTLVPSVYQASRLNAVLWTVGIEAQAYLLFPFAAKAFDRKPLTTYASLLLGGAAYRLAICKTLPDLTLWINQLPSFLDVYANGMLAAWLFAKWESREFARFDRTIQTACTIGACACLFAVWRIICWQSDISWQRDGLHVGQAIIRFPLTALGGAWLLLASRSFSGFQAIFSNKVARWFAGISYALYIWHQLLAVKLREIWRFPPYRAAENPQFVAEQPWQWQYMIVCAAASVMAAALVTYIIERPSVKLLQRFEHSGIQ
ncbi:MAG: hypothetical protein LBS72_06215, partial [Oscillospiraceae bacterium]|nr:hypothetical protein [Oscillospiraceae bacterium]